MENRYFPPGSRRPLRRLRRRLSRVNTRTPVIALLSVVGVSAFFYYAAHPPRLPNAYTLSEDTRALPEAARRAVERDLLEAFGTPEDPRVPAAAREVVTAANLANGRDFYRRHCLHCHGVTGDGAGTTAPFMTPRPRDYRAGKFKITTTAPSAKPSRQDLLETLKNGLPGTLMPAFSPFYDDATLLPVVDYVIHLSLRGETEVLLTQAWREALDEEEEPDEDVLENTVALVADRWQEAEGKVVTPSVPRPPMTPESIARGREIFLSPKTNCFGCHGKEGRGDGESVPEGGFSDDWGNRIYPADLTRGVYRGGSRPVDLWRRIYSGVKGTQMPGFNDALSEEEIWHVVNFLKSIVETPER